MTATTRPPPRRPRRPSFAQRTSPVDDPTGLLGIRLLVQQRGERARLVPKHPTLVLPIENAIVDVACGALRQSIDPSSWMLVPARDAVSVGATSVVAHALLLTLSPALVRRVAETYAGEIDPARFRRYLATPHLLARTTWVNELAHRYLFERAACKKRDNDATRFLETEIAKELYFLCHERAKKQDRPSLVETHGPVVRRALEHLEKHLFEGSVLKDLARATAPARARSSASSAASSARRRSRTCAPDAWTRRSCC
jgi:hypothetical protein